MTKFRITPGGFRGDKRAVSPAISTVILTSAVVVMLLVTITFANNFLNSRMAENEFSTVKQFMQTVALQVDDVAWTIGRTQTVRYASKYGQVNFESLALNYSVYVNDVFLTSFTTGILLFNMPISQYSVTNNYHERIFPSSDDSLLQVGTSAPVCHVFAIEKLPMNDGSFIRIVVAPSIRMLNSTISTGGEVKNYFKFYLSILSPGIHPHRSQSITLEGKKVSVEIEDSINTIKIQAAYPKVDLGFGQDFFDFESSEEVIDVPDGSVMEFYTGEVILSLGLHS